MTDLVTSLVTGFTTTANSMLSAIGQIVPVMLPVVGGLAVVTLGIKVFRKMT